MCIPDLGRDEAHIPHGYSRQSRHVAAKSMAIPTHYSQLGRHRPIPEVYPRAMA